MIRLASAADFFPGDKGVQLNLQAILSQLPSQPAPPVIVNVPPAVPQAVPWQTTLSAFGSLLAVAIAVTVALVETARARRARREADAVKDERRREQRRGTASRISGWVEDDYLPDSTGSSYIRKVTAYLANSASEPVFEVNASIGVGSPRYSIGPLSIPKPIATLPPGRELSWDITIPLLAHEDTHTQSIAIEVGFSDPQGNRWTRSFEGGLVETTGEVSALFDSDDTESILRQIGRLDPLNPMAVALAFVHALTADPLDRELFDQVIAPEAVGWKSATDAELQGISQELTQFGIAGFVHYPAPHVAYVKIVAQEFEKSQVAAGDSIEVEVRFLVLTYVRQRGWRVFGYGNPPTSPDRILFPEAELSDDQVVPHYSPTVDPE